MRVPGLSVRDKEAARDRETARDEATAADSEAAADISPLNSPQEPLRFYNGYGGFTGDGSEYVIRLTREVNQGLRYPPQPWINVIANEDFGFLISETGAGYTWSSNSRERRLTPWYNDPVCDPHGEAFYIRDEETGAFWSVLPGPTPGAGDYEMRHGFGYSRCRHLSQALTQEATLFVPRHDPVRLTKIRLVNQSRRKRVLSLYAYYRLVLGTLPASSGRFIITQGDIDPGTLLARNQVDGEYADSVAFAAVIPPDQTRSLHISGDRAAFIGRGGSPVNPAALRLATTEHEGTGHIPVLDGRTGTSLDPCFAQQVVLELQPGETCEVVFILGEAKDEQEAHNLIARLRAPGAVAQAWQGMRTSWRSYLSALQISTPSPALDILVNGWLPYQTLSCRLWGRSALYQSGGAFGYRDQLQDAGALIHLNAELTRSQILLHAAHQFREGDVLHWWHPPLGRGLRTRFADDLLWLPYLTTYYIQTTGDHGILNEPVPFLTARPLQPDQDEVFLQPEESSEAADLYEHCCRALDRSLTEGLHGLPLFGAGDWNDGMNRVGRYGRGESTWLGFFLYKVLGEFTPCCEARRDGARAARYSAYRQNLQAALNDAGWDGAWYRRGYYDDGTPLGSHASDECRIDALAQAWAVLSGVAPPQRAAQAMDAVEQHLISVDDGLIRLLAPPFDKTPHDPGYIKGYVPGIRENGGQYTHAALWVVQAMAELGRNDRVAALLDLLNPINHSRSEQEVARYKVEPYVVAADVYGAPPHIGRGGWTWYTGSAGWMIRVALESLLGFCMTGGDTLRMKPCIPNDWPEFTIRYDLPDKGIRYVIHVVNPARDGKVVAGATIDGQTGKIERGACLIPLLRDGKQHRVELVLGPQESDGG
jgi:cyclic beta-1,2-glucan synthetase